MSINKAILKEYNLALHYNCLGDSTLLESFKLKYPIEFNIMDKMYRRRTDLIDTLDALKFTNEPIYWFTLTFKNEKDINKIESKRKEAQRFLNNIAPVYIMIEEYSKKNTERYHIHGFLIFKWGYGFNNFKQWHSRQNLLLLNDDNYRQKVKYLTKYTVKDVPRLRRSKMCVKLYQAYKRVKKFRTYFLDIKQSVMQDCIDGYVNLF